jgi:hypothetical protein
MSIHQHPADAKAELLNLMDVRETEKKKPERTCICNENITHSDPDFTTRGQPALATAGLANNAGQALFGDLAQTAERRVRQAPCCMQ